ncbi:tetratricopeptide repeat protein, partial [Candidatus Peregrinibacteria bacterium]|nr:tetratricopeptide repeat protein [Candidatus Peregrinibacteria bacterium]
EPQELSEPVDNITTTTEEVSNNPSYLERIQKGDTLFEGGYYPLAITEYEVATTLEPTLSEPYYKLGQAYFYDYSYETAREALDIAIQNNENNLEAQLLLGKVYITIEQFETAKTHFDSLGRGVARVEYYQGLMNVFFKDYDNAAINFNFVIESGEDGTLSTHSQTYLAAIEEAALAEDGSPLYLQTLIAQGFAETAEVELAMASLYDVLREEPTYRDAWIILGHAYLTQELYRDAQDALLKALELDPTKPETRYFLGLSYFGEDDYASAVTQLKLAVESGYEPLVQAYQKLADVAVLAEQFDIAVDAYENVLILNSADVNLYIRPIWLYLDKLDYADRAQELAEQAVQEHTNTAMSYNLLGWVQVAQEDFSNAEQNLNYALILDANLAAAYLNLGWLEQKRDNLEQAKEHYKRCYTIDPSGSVGNLAANRYNEILTQEESNPPTL